MNFLLQAVLLVAVVCCCVEELNACEFVERGIHSNYSVWSSDGDFSSDAVSRIENDGQMYVCAKSMWLLYETKLTVENGSWIGVGVGDVPLYIRGFPTAEIRNSSIMLRSDSRAYQWSYAKTTFTRSAAQLDHSDLNIYYWTTATIDSSRLQLQNSSLNARSTNRINIVGSSLVLASSVIYLNDATIFNLTDTTILMTLSKITTGRWCNVTMASKSLLSFNHLNLILRDDSTFSMGPGATLYSTGSNIKLGKGAKLSIVDNCLFQGTLVIPDSTSKVIGNGDVPDGFTCMPTVSALQELMNNLGH